MTTSSNSLCGMPLLKKDNQGNLRFCTHKSKFLVQDGNMCCGIHAKTLGIDTSSPHGVCECSICLTNCSPKQLKTLPCEHQFHKKCVNKWLKKNNSCPLCRAVITPEPVPEPIRDPDEQLRTIVHQTVATLVMNGVQISEIAHAFVTGEDPDTYNDLRSVNSFLTAMARSIGV